MKRRYRYILSGETSSKDQIHNFRLIGGNNLGDESIVIRVNIPSNLKLNKYKYDGYSTTNDKRTLEELGYTVIIKINNKWKEREDLKKFQPYQCHEVLEQEGYRNTKELGYLNTAQYREYLRNKEQKQKDDWTKAKKIYKELINCECSAYDLKGLSENILLKVLQLFVNNRIMHDIHREKKEDK